MGGMGRPKSSTTGGEGKMNKAFGSCFTSKALPTKKRFRNEKTVKMKDLGNERSGK